mgnify:CR=1 FL=1
MEKENDLVVLAIESGSLCISLNFYNGDLYFYSINYRTTEEYLNIIGTDTSISVEREYYIDKEDKEKTVERINFEIQEDKDLLKRFNDTIMIRHKEKIMKRQITGNEVKQLLLVLLDYIDELTKKGLPGLTEKVRNVVKSESIKFEYKRPEIITLEGNKKWSVIDYETK